MPQSADFHFDTEADCFVVTDAAGNELCRTRAPHDSMGKFAAGCITDWLNLGILIFPTTGDTPTPQCPTK